MRALAHRGAALALLSMVAAGCAGGLRPVLQEYRVVGPRRMMVAPVWLASFTTDELGGRLSPDGRSLLYAGNQKGNFDIWVKDLTTGVPRRLTRHVTKQIQPAWDPAGERVAFISMFEDAKGDLTLLEDEKFTRLTGRVTEDAYPVFAPDGRAIYLASGPEGLSRIVKLDIESKDTSPVTGWDATHPAVSRDGRYLAYTQFDGERRGQIAVMRLSDRKVRIITTPEFHAGFPAFSPDGRHLYYSRFLAGTPHEPLERKQTAAALWRVELFRALGAASPAAAATLARPVTSGRTGVLFAQVTPRGVVFTTSRDGNLDIGMLPTTGQVPRLATAKQQLQLALDQEDPADQLLCLEHVIARGPGPEASRALYLSTRIHVSLGAFFRARQLHARLRKESAMKHGDWAYLSLIDAAVLEVARKRREEKQSGAAVSPEVIKKAQERLGGLPLPPRPSSMVAAHLLLRRGDLQRLGGKTQAAIRSYETIATKYPGQRALAAEAKYRLGTLFASLRDPDLLATYYLTLFAEFPDQGAWLERSAQAVVKLLADRPPAAQIEKLRQLMDKNRDKPLFWTVAQASIGALYVKMKRLDMAIEAMAQITRKKPKRSSAALLRLRTRASFELGRLSLANYDRLRKHGRLSEALGFYEKALDAYAQVVKAHDPGHKNYRRARAEFLRLSLLMAAQLEREGEVALAEKQYRKILTLDPHMLQAHRKLIQFGIRKGRLDQLTSEYEARLARDASDAVGHYALGYLATFSKDLDADDLKRAEKHLKRAISLAPLSPFGHMTLGWVHDMRERALGQLRKGWLEEAILLYDRAYNLNDARVDVQTEADLLVNLCNVFANLGNGWKQAFEFCSLRKKLKIPFVSKKRAALHHLTFGRAASARDQYALAHEELQRALDLARDLGQRPLEAEAVARLGLNANLSGEYERSNRYFRRAMNLYRKLGQKQMLASFSRSMAYNLSLMKKRRAVHRQLDRSRRLLTKHGTAAIESFSPNGDPGRSTAGYGYDPRGEAYLAMALRGDIYRAVKAWPRVLPLLERRIKNRQAAIAHGEPRDDELGRELLQLHNSLGMTQLRLGMTAASRRSLAAAMESVRKMQTDKEAGFQPHETLFPLQTAVTLNDAEQLLRSLSSGQEVAAARVSGVYDRLRQLEAHRASHAKKNKKDLLGQRLRLALWVDLALVTYHAGVRGLAAGERAGGGAGGKAARATRRLLARGAPFVKAIRLLREVARETDPGRLREAGDATADVRADRAYLASQQGTLEPLWRPLSPVEELRWFVLASLNLVHLAGVFTPASKLEGHPTTRLLKELTALGVQHELGALRYVAAAELAYRRDDLTAMKAAVRGFLDRSPLLFDRGDLRRARGVRRRIFQRAVDLGLQKKNLEAALTFAEQEERRAFVDSLAELPLEGWGRLEKPLSRLNTLAGKYRAVLAAQDPSAPPGPRKAWRGKLERIERRIQADLRSLRATSPRAAALLSVPDFPYMSLVKSLDPGDVAVTALVSGGRVRLISILPGVAPGVTLLPKTARALRKMAAAEPARLVKLLAPTLKRLTRGSKRVYLDLGRIGPGAAALPVLPGFKVVRLATLWELLDARAVSNLALQGGLVVDPRPGSESLARAIGYRSLPAREVILDGLARRLEPAGIQIWSQAMRFDSAGAASMRLPLHDQKRERLGDLHLGRAVGMPLRAHLLVMPPPRYVRGNERAQRVALMRLVHSMGVPAVLFVPGLDGRSARTARRLKEVLGRTAADDLAGAARGGDVALFGHGGLSPDQAKALAKKMIKKTAYAGVGAFNARPRRLTEAVEHLESCLRYMAFLGDTKYLDGALEFLTQSYTLLEDYARAVPRSRRLLALRKEAIDKARAAGKAGAVLKAQAKWVKAIKDMAWLRMRNEQFDEALAANQQAIDLYHQIKRPSLALDSYSQRSIIAEKKKDMKLALEFAERALKTARAPLAKKPKDSAARARVVKAAGRVSRLQRQRFSNYRAAMTASGLALANIPEVEISALGPLEARIKALRAKAKTLKGKKKEMAALKKEFRAVGGKRRTILQAIKDRVQTILEITRIQSARGDYNRAVLHATQALEIAKKARLASQDAPLLELVNNLYYTGAYGQALIKASEGLAGARRPVRKIQFYNARGTIYAALGRTADARKELEAALAIATRLGNAAEMAASHNNLGNALRLAGRFGEAKAHFSRALDLDRAADDRLGMAFDHANLGLTEELMGRLRDARASLRRALALSQKIGAPLNELKALAGLGRMDLAGDKVSDAHRRIRKGLAISLKLGLRNWAWRFHLLRGRVLRREGKARRAVAELRKGLQIVEGRPPRIRRALGTPQVEEAPDDLYDELIDLLAEQGDAEAAFDMAERKRSRSFVDLVSKNAASLPAEQARTLMRRITSLQMELEATQASRMRAASRSDRVVADREISRIQKELKLSGDALSALNPRLPAMVAVDAWPLSRLKPLLAARPGAVFLIYAATRHRLVIWTLTGGALKMHRVKVGRAALLRKVQRFRQALVRFHRIEELSRGLYDQLVKPAMPRGSGPPRLVIIPSGPLHVLPFTALHDGADYLVASRTISYLSSVNALRRQPKKAAAPARRVSFGWAGSALRPLSFTVREAEALGRTFPGATVVQGSDATRARFIAEATTAGLLHVATHADYQEEAPLRTSLELADGKLPVLEVLGLSLKSPLVILSACDTGLGKLDGADGILGLQQAFLAAGARQVISSLWRVSDLGAALLMKHLFRQLKKEPAPLALRKAQNLIRRRFLHPGFWAGFQIAGAP